MISEQIATGVLVALTAGLTAVALHETAETARAYAPNKKHNGKDKDYQSLIWG